MAIIQEAFYIPDDIALGLATGTLRRMGGVVRHAVGPNKGQIVKHLDPINLEKSAKQVQSIGEKVLEFGKGNKKALIITGAIVSTVTAGTFVYNKVKNQEPKVVIEFRSALKTYINEIRTGKLKIDTVNSLVNYLDAMKQHKNFDKISVKLSVEELDVIVNRIYEYTIQLAQNNSVELTDEETYKDTSSSATILNLQRYLQAQKRIFEMAV